MKVVRYDVAHLAHGNVRRLAAELDAIFLGHTVMANEHAIRVIGPNADHPETLREARKMARLLSPGGKISRGPVRLIRQESTPTRSALFDMGLIVSVTEPLHRGDRWNVDIYKPSALGMHGAWLGSGVWVVSDRKYHPSMMDSEELDKRERTELSKAIRAWLGKAKPSATPARTDARSAIERREEATMGAKLRRAARRGQL